jgi:hypothetical protein
MASIASHLAFGAALGAGVRALGQWARPVPGGPARPLLRSGMVDQERRRQERAWLADMDDPEALERAIATLRRAGQPVPRVMRERCVYPARMFDSRLALKIVAVDPAGRRLDVGRTPCASDDSPDPGPHLVPPHRVWWVEPVDRITDLMLQAIVEDVVAQEVPGLVLDGTHVTDRGLKTLAEASHLRWLSLRGCVRVGDRGLEALAGLTRLESLDLGGCSAVTDVGLGHLAGLVELGRLTLSGLHQITDTGLARLSQLRELGRLRIGACRHVTDVGLASVVASASGLMDLDLAWCQRLTDAGLAALDGLTQLERLDVGGCTRLTDAALARIGTYKNLLSLSLESAARITDNGLAHLDGLSRLTHLDLDLCEGVSDDGMAHVARLLNLTNLGLGGCNLITDAGLGHLANLQRLSNLSLNRCDRLTNAGLAHLARVKTLLDLDLSWCSEFTDRGVIEHLGALPSLRRVNLAGCDKVKDYARQTLVQNGCAVE